MKAVPLAVYKRQDTGKGAARQLRLEGSIPGILYGEHTSPLPLSLNRHQITTILHKSTSEHILVDLTIDNGGGGPELALLREVQHDPITEEILHVDFLHISPTRKIRVTVPVRLTGLADGVKNFGGILQHITRELEIDSLPADIPELIDVDVTELGIGGSLHVGELKLERIVVVTPADRTIASVVPPTVIKEVVPTAEAAAVPAESAAGAPEVITEKKETDEEAEAPTDKKAKKEKEKDRGKDKGK
jgi:large subunit ribosomal protein L25